jgi:hypothetical protein
MRLPKLSPKNPIIGQSMSHEQHFTAVHNPL